LLETLELMVVDVEFEADREEDMTDDLAELEMMFVDNVRLDKRLLDPIADEEIEDELDLLELDDEPERVVVVSETLVLVVLDVFTLVIPFIVFTVVVGDVVEEEILLEDDGEREDESDLEDESNLEDVAPDELCELWVNAFEEVVDEVLLELDPLEMDVVDMLDQIDEETLVLFLAIEVDAELWGGELVNMLEVPFDKVFDCDTSVEADVNVKILLETGELETFEGVTLDTGFVLVEDRDATIELTEEDGEDEGDVVLIVVNDDDGAGVLLTVDVEFAMDDVDLSGLLVKEPDELWACLLD
jgi:hypothetical protein